MTIVAHRRPNLATAPTITSSAIADHADADDAPHGRGRDRDAEGLRCRFAARRGAHRGDVIAGDRLGGRRDQRLHFLVLVRRNAIDGLGLELDLPAARRRAGQFDLLGRGRAGIGEDDRDRGLDPGRRARAEQALTAGDVDLGLAGDVERQIGGGGCILGRRPCAVTLYLPAATVFGGRTLSLTSFDWPASSGSALSSWLPYCSVKVASKFCGACAARLTVTFLPLSFLMPSCEFEIRLGRPAQFGKLRIQRELGRQIRLASVTATGRDAFAVAPLRVDRQIGGADRGVLRHVEREAPAARWYWSPAAPPRPAGRRRSGSPSSPTARRRPTAPAAQAAARSSAAAD